MKRAIRLPIIFFAMLAMVGCITLSEWRVMTTSQKWKAVSSYYHVFLTGLEKVSIPILTLVEIVAPETKDVIEVMVKPALEKGTEQLDKLDLLIQAQASELALQEQAEKLAVATVAANQAVADAKVIAEGVGVNPQSDAGTSTSMTTETASSDTAK